MVKGKIRQNLYGSAIVVSCPYCEDNLTYLKEMTPDHLFECEQPDKLDSKEFNLKINFSESEQVILNESDNWPGLPVMYGRSIDFEFEPFETPKNHCKECVITKILQGVMTIGDDDFGLTLSNKWIKKIFCDGQCSAK